MQKIFNSNIFDQPAFWMLVSGLFALSITLSAVFGISAWLLLAGILFILSLILLVKRPFLLLCLLIIARMSLDYSAEYFTFTFFDISISLSQLLGIGVAILGIINIITHRKALWNFQLSVPFLILFLWGSFTLTYSLASYSTLYELLRLFDLFALGFLAYTAIQKTADFKKLLLTFFISGILPTAFAIYQWVLGIGIQDEAFSVPRIFGTFSHPNVFSLYLFSLIVFACLYFLVFVRAPHPNQIQTNLSPKELLLLGLLGVLALMLFFTYARVAWIALFVFAFLLSLFRFRKLLIPLIILPLVLFTFSQNFQERVLESFTRRPDSSIVWRQNLWHDVVTNSIQDGNFWLGSGMNTFPLVSENLRGISFGSNDPHNDFVKFFVEGGALGLAVYVLYLISISFILLKNYFHNREQPPLHLAFFILILFFFTLELASLSDNVFKNTPVLWLFFIALSGLLALAQKEKLTFISDKK